MDTPTPLSLLRLLNITYYTQRHLNVIKAFLDSGEEDVSELLDGLGYWTEKDLEVADRWFERYKHENT